MVFRSTLPALALATALPLGAEEAPLAPSTVLFVGNSCYYYNDSLHNHVLRLAREAVGEASKDYAYRSITISGGSLKHHPIGHCSGGLRGLKPATSGHPAFVAAAHSA